MERVLLTIEGMSCNHCVRSVDHALRKVGGVSVDRVDLGSAVIAYDPEVVGSAQIEEAISGAGYRVLSMGRAA